MSYIKISILLFLFLNISVHAYDRDLKEIKLNNWNILYDQEESIHQIKNSKLWKQIDLGTYFKHPYQPKRDYQYVWLKSTFIIPDNPTIYHGLNLGQFYYKGFIYINNKLIHQKEDKEYTSIHYPRHYILPSHVLKKGENEILIYMGIYGKQNGGIIGDISICSKELFKAKKNYSIFLFYHLPMSIISLNIFLIIFLSIYFIFNKNEKSIIFGINCCLMSILYLALVYMNNPISHDLRITFIHYIIILFTINSIFLVQSFYYNYLKNTNRIIIVYLIIITIIIFTNIDTTSFLYLAHVINILTLMLTYALMPYIMYRLYSNNKDKVKLFLVIMISSIPLIIISKNLIFYSFLYYNFIIDEFLITPIIIIGSFIIIIKDRYKTNRSNTLLI